MFTSCSRTINTLSKEDINTQPEQTLNTLYQLAGQHLAPVLIFPEILKAGLGIGAEHSERALCLNDQNTIFYSLVAAFFGFQAGKLTKSQVIFFMDKRALDGFKKRSGWKVGVNGSIALIKLSGGGEIDSNNTLEPIVGFAFSCRG